MQRCTCQALLQQEHLQVDALELTPAAERPAGHTSGSATPPSAGCMDNVSTTALLVELPPTRSHFCQPVLVAGRDARPLCSPGQYGGHQPRVSPVLECPARAGYQGPFSDLCLSLLSLLLPEGGDRELEVGEGGAAPCRGSRGNSWLLSRASQAGRRGTALPAGSQSGALHQAAPAASNYVLSKSMGYNWTIKISLSSQLWLPQPAVS